MIYYQQHDSLGCGAACLAMVFSHYGKSFPVTYLRNSIGTDARGVSFKGLFDVCKKNNFKVVGVKGKPDKFSIAIPCIAHLDFFIGNKHVEHYVVVKKALKGRVEVWDPNPNEGRTLMSYDSFKEKWSGKLLLIVPDNRFKASKKREKSALIQLCSVVTEHRRLVFFAFLSSLLVLILGLIVSFFQKYIFDEVLFAKAVFSLNSLFVGILVVKVCISLLDFIRSLIVNHLAYKIDMQLDFSFVKKLFDIPLSFYESRKTGDIISRLSDLKDIRRVLSSVVLSVLTDGFIVLLVFPVLLISNYRVLILSIVNSILISAISIVCMSVYKRKHKDLKKINSEISAYIVNMITGIKTIKSLNVEDFFLSEYEKKRISFVESSWSVDAFSNKQGVLTNIVNSLSDCLILWFGCYSILSSSMTFGSMFFLISLSGFLSSPLIRLASIQSEIQQVVVEAERVYEILCTGQEIEDNLAKMKIKGKIEFDKVCFHYGSRPNIINNLSFVIESGTSVGIVGFSGCGKSTILNLILKLLTPNSGRIFVDGKNLSYLDGKMLRQQIGYVSQNVFLFPDTFFNNITMGDDRFSLADVMQASKLVGIHEYIESVPDGYFAKIDEDGGNLSGGERQRIAIARAVIKDSPVVIFDEVTNSLDLSNENKVQELIHSLRDNGKTVIIVSHKHSIIESCDNVLFIENGFSSAYGRHKDLLEKNYAYQTYWRSKNESC